MSVTILNTTAGISVKTVETLESDQTITGAKTFDRDPSAPFVVVSGSAVVTNLDADKLDGLEATDFAKLGTASTFTTTPTVGAGIKFPASFVSQSDVNTLDDYKENTWTPVLGGSGGTSGQTYGTQIGTYTKVGRKVDAFFSITLTAKGTITGGVVITGLPFPLATTDSGSVHVTYWDALAVAQVFVGGVISSSTVSVYMASAAATGLTQPTTTEISNTTTLRGVLSYQAAT